MHILTILRLGQTKVVDKLTPLLHSEQVRRLTLVRHAPVDLPGEKVAQIIHNVGLDQDGLRGGRRARLHNLWACFYNGLRTARQDRPEVVLAFNLVPYGLIAWLVARGSSARAIVSLIGTDFNRYVRGSHLLRFMLRRFDAVTVFGEDARAALIADGLAPERVFHLPNCVNTSRFKPDPAVQPVYDLIYVGALRQLKRVDLVLHVLRSIRQHRPQTTLLIVGDGEARSALEALAQELGLADAVTFRGWTDQVVGSLRQSRVFISLSASEGLPMAMLEAMSTGLPPIVTGVGAIGTVVHDGENGCLLPPPTPGPDAGLIAAAADCALALLNDPEHYQRLRDGALKVRQSHGYPHATQVWDDVLRSLQR